MDSPCVLFVWYDGNAGESRAANSEWEPRIVILDGGTFETYLEKDVNLDLLREGSLNPVTGSPVESFKLALTDVVALLLKQQRCLMLEYKDGTTVFQARSKEERDQWVQALNAGARYESESSLETEDIRNSFNKVAVKSRNVSPKHISIHPQDLAGARNSPSASSEASARSPFGASARQRHTSPLAVHTQPKYNSNIGEASPSDSPIAADSSVKVGRRESLKGAFSSLLSSKKSKEASRNLEAAQALLHSQSERLSAAEEERNSLLTRCAETEALLNEVEAKHEEHVRQSRSMQEALETCREERDTLRRKVQDEVELREAQKGELEACRAETRNSLSKVEEMKAALGEAERIRMMLLQSNLIKDEEELATIGRLQTALASLREVNKGLLPSADCAS